VTVPPDGKEHARAGLAFFKQELYAAAAQEYDAAILAGGSASECREWETMRDLAKANATAEINVYVPQLQYFDKEDLLKPRVKDGDLPRPERRRPGRCCLKRLRLWLGDQLGAVVTVLMDHLIDLVGRVPGYHGRIWTNWYRHCWLVGVLLLAYMRELLNANNLKAPTHPGSWSAFSPEDSDLLSASPISVPPTEAGTTSPTQRKVRPARDS
jgi:hypothetical protein